MWLLRKIQTWSIWDGLTGWIWILNTVMNKMQFLLYQNHLFFHLLWAFIFLLTNSYMPWPNLALLEWREGLMLATVRLMFQVPAQVCLRHHLPLHQTERPMGWALLTSKQQRYYQVNEIQCFILMQWHFFHTFTKLWLRISENTKNFLRLNEKALRTWSKPSPFYGLKEIEYCLSNVFRGKFGTQVSFWPNRVLIMWSEAKEKATHEDI